MRIFLQSAFLVLAMIFSVGVRAQQIEKKVLEMSCDCIGKIDYNLERVAKNDSIKSCINTAVIYAEVTQSMIGQSEVDTLGRNVIVIDKNYDEILSQLMDDCPYLKANIAVNNALHANSMSSNKKALDLYKDAEEYFNRKEFDKALKKYEKAVKADPNFAFAWDNLGICYRKLDQYPEAIECYKKSLTLDPKGTVPLMNMAVAYDLMNDKASAIGTYNRFIALHPDDPEGFYGISRLKNQTGDYANALEDAFKAFTLYEDISSPYTDDAINVIREIVSNLKKEGKTAIYNTFAEKYGLTKLKE